MEQNVFKILLGVSGSVGSLHIPNLVKSLLETTDDERFKFEICIVLTENAKHFLGLHKWPPSVTLYDDSSEWTWRQMGDPVTHIELRRWADVMVVAPLTANTLAKLAQGICDNLLTSTVRAWDLKKPILICPAMNTVMWEHPITRVHINTLKSWGYKEISPIVKFGMCGDTGMGGLAEVETIVKEIKLICGEKI